MKNNKELQEQTTHYHSCLAQLAAANIMGDWDKVDKLMIELKETNQQIMKLRTNPQNSDDSNH
jgi:hypothetical protein